MRGLTIQEKDECWDNTKEFVTFGGDPERKEKMVKRARDHRLADRVVQGIYWAHDGANFRGCAIGCLATDTVVTEMSSEIEESHTGGASICSEFDLPAELALLAEAAFEGLPREEALPWPELFAAAIPVGVTLSNAQVRKWRVDLVKAVGEAGGHENGWVPEAREFVLTKLKEITPDAEYEKMVEAYEEIAKAAIEEDDLVAEIVRRRRERMDPGLLAKVDQVSREAAQ